MNLYIDSEHCEYDTSLEARGDLREAWDEMLDPLLCGAELEIRLFIVLFLVLLFICVSGVHF